MFFLFSDLLVYASVNLFGKFRARAMISLRTIRISNIAENKLHNAFQIQSPIKSFPVVAADSDEKANWMRHIDR